MMNRRYPGARPFTREQQAIFYGREEDVQRLQRMLSLEPLSVLYGKSGYGKSSLINAGLLPKIEQNKHEQAVLIRFQAWTEDSTVSPLERIRHSLGELPHQTKELDKLSPQEDSLWYWAKAYQYSHPENRLILLFDQFEELFSYPEEDIRAFKQQLAELVRGQLPTRFDEILDIAADRDEAPLTPAEEEQLYQPLNVRINFSIRSDRMHLLDQLSDYLPNVLRNNMELKALKEEDAEKALVFPAQMQGAFTAAPFSYSAAAKDKIINFLKNKEDGLVEAIQLQILCTSFEDKAIREKVTHFDEMSKEELDAIIKNFYHDQLAKIPHAHDRELAAILLEDGLVDKERKERLTLHETQIERLFHVPSSLLGDLVGFSLLRREPDRRSGYTYELSHDTFIKPALAAREKREIAKAEQKRQQQAEELKAEKRKRRNSYLFAAFAGLLAMAAIVASIIASQQQAKAEQALTQAQAEKARADSLKDEATTQLALTQIARDSAQTAKLRADSLLQVAISQEALAKAEAAKGNRLETTLAGSDDDIYDYLLAEGANFFNKGQYQNALTYWANAAFFGENKAGKKQLQKRIALAKIATLAENDFRNGRLEKARTGFQQLLAPKTELNLEQAQKRITQINQSQQIWASATEGKLLDTIQSLTLEGDISSIPEEAQQMSRLSELIIQYNKEDAIFLNAFPPTIDSVRFNKVNFAELPSLNNFAGLKLVEIEVASRIGSISKEWIDQLPNLKELTIYGNYNLRQIPPINQLLNLKELTISNNYNLNQIPPINQLLNLEKLYIYGNDKLNQIPPINQLINLKELTISNNYKLNQIPPINQLINLKELTIANNDNLDQIPLINQLLNLKELEISKNYNLNQIPPINQLINLEKLTISNNYNLNQIPPLNQLLNLKELTISNNDNLNQIPPLNQLLNLKELTIANNHNLNQIPPLNQLLNLKELTIANNDNLNQIPPLNQLLNLKELEISNNDNLNQIPPLNQLLNLEKLYIYDNDNLNQIPPLNQLLNLEKLYISNHKNLTQVPLLPSQMDSLKTLSIKGTYFLNYSLPIQSLPAVIGDYTNLEELNLVALELTDLPPSFEKLKDTLKKLDLRYNPMTEETVEKWRKLLPNTEVIFKPRPENK